MRVRLAAVEHRVTGTEAGGGGRRVRGMKVRLAAVAVASER